jgi:RND family efflux transporter MFP subunit
MKKARLIAMLILLVFLSSCTEDQRSWLARFFKVGGSAVPVAVEQVTVEERDVKVVVPATLAPSEQVEIRLPYEAHIEAVSVNIGDTVKPGTVLCRLSLDELNLRLAGLRAEQRDAQATLEKNQYFLRNRDRLLDEGRIDKNQYDNLEAEVNTNESAVERLRTQITALENQTSNINITATIAGVIQAKYATPGGVISEKQPLFIITKVDPIAVVFSLAPYEAKTIRAGMPIVVRFRELPGEMVTASVASVGSQINPDTGRFDVKSLIPNPNGTYKTGMIAQAEFSGAEKQKFFNVPAEAVITDGRRHFVFTVSQGVAHKVPVMVREIKGDTAEVIEGLVENDLVVVKGNKQLQEGSVVDIW